MTRHHRSVFRVSEMHGIGRTVASRLESAKVGVSCNVNDGEHSNSEADDELKVFSKSSNVYYFLCVNLLLGDQFNKKLENTAFKAGPSGNGHLDSEQDTGY